MNPLPLDSSGDAELEGAFDRYMSAWGMVSNSLLAMQRVQAIANSKIRAVVCCYPTTFTSSTLLLTSTAETFQRRPARQWCRRVR